MVANGAWDDGPIHRFTYVVLVVGAAGERKVWQEIGFIVGLRARGGAYHVPVVAHSKKPENGVYSAHINLSRPSLPM